MRPGFALLSSADPLLVCLAYFIGFPIGVGMIFAPSGALLPELFDANVTIDRVEFRLSDNTDGVGDYEPQD